jgi:cyclopropane fatty-acyl-phospholipid synthase-like methyltransferase
LICGKNKTLEVGCGRGDNLIRQTSRGYDVVGIDKDVSVCDGKRILNFDFENFESDTKYDFIYAIHVFEHIKNPDKFISLIKKHLADEGEFAIEIPSVRDPLISLYNNNSYQKFYWYPFHMYYYDMDNITNLFGKNGIKVNITLIQRYGIFNHLRWIILGKPGNLNPHIPILDDIYKFVLTRIIKKSDTMLIRGKKK